MAKEMTYQQKVEISKNYKANYSAIAKEIVELTARLDHLKLVRKCFYETHPKLKEPLADATYYDMVSTSKEGITLDTDLAKELLPNWETECSKTVASKTNYATRLRKKSK